MSWLLALVLSRAAGAHCVVSEAPMRGGTRISVKVEGAAAPCRLVTLRGDEPLEVKPSIETAGGGRMRIGRRDHLYPLPGGVTAVLVPELLPGDTLLLEVETEGTTLDFRVGGPLPAPGRGPKRELRRYETGMEHPGWAFADPSRGSTTSEVTWSVVEGEPLPLPLDAEVVEAPGLFALPGALLPAAGATEASCRYVVPGVSPQGVEVLLPGDLLVMGGPGISWVATSAGDVTVRNEGEQLSAAAGPGGGALRYRVASVARDPVIPDATVYIAGITSRFRSVSLPEPAIPLSLQRLDPPEQTGKLIAAVTGRTTVEVPGADPLQPRRLNRAWRSGWMTAVEKGLVLQAMLVQARLPAEWHLSGADADPVTFTGFDHVLVRLGDRWIDPACNVCAKGEFSPELSGKPLLSPWGTGTLPKAPGELSRAVTIVGEEVQQVVTLTGVEALRLRVALDGVDPGRREGVLRETLGIPTGEIVKVEGIDALGAEVRVVVESAP